MSAWYHSSAPSRAIHFSYETLRPKVVHAGTKAENGQVIATGGRVLNVTARGASLADAQARAYAMVDGIDWPGGFFRRDIGWRAL